VTRRRTPPANTMNPFSSCKSSPMLRSSGFQGPVSVPLSRDSSKTTTQHPRGRVSVTTQDGEIQIFTSTRSSSVIVFIVFTVFIVSLYWLCSLIWSSCHAGSCTASHPSSQTGEVLRASVSYDIVHWLLSLLYSPEEGRSSFWKSLIGSLWRHCPLIKHRLNAFPLLGLAFRGLKPTIRLVAALQTDVR
jgi:hypothetical protein